MRTSGYALAAAAVMATASPAAHAVTLAFECTSNNSGICGSIAGQIALTVQDRGAGQAWFEFSNTGTVASTLTDFYWRSPSLSGGGDIAGSAGVAASWGASPPNPGGSVGWNASVSAEAINPQPANGVSPGEWARFSLGYTGTFSDMLSTLPNGVALHVQSVGPRGDSEWLRAVPVTAVPEPTTYLLMLAGAAAIAFLTRRRGVR